MTDYSGKRILSTAPITDESIQILEQVAPVITAPSPDEDTLMGYLENTVGIVCRGEGVVTARMIEAAPDLRVIGRPGAGYDTVDLEAAGARKIPLVYAPIGGFAVAEGTVGLLLSLVKRLSMTDRALRAGDWNVRYAVPTGDLVTRTLGIVGLGRIGSQVARLIKPFDMRVLGCDPFVDPKTVADLGVELVDFDTLLAESDYVTLHVPLEDSTLGMIDGAAVARMREGAFLLNLARGKVVESLDVLSEGLESGQLGGVASMCSRPSHQISPTASFRMSAASSPRTTSAPARSPSSASWIRCRTAWSMSSTAEHPSTASIRKCSTSASRH